MSIALTFASTVTVVETFTGDYVSPVDATVTINQLNESESLTASTGVPVTKVAAYQKTMSSGSATIDLTALPGLTADETVVGTGLKVQVAKFRNLSTNANNITVAKGASNGYGLIGSAWSVILAPGQSLTFWGDEAAPDIASNAKTIDITGTGSQVLEVQFVMG